MRRRRGRGVPRRAVSEDRGLPRGDGPGAALYQRSFGPRRRDGSRDAAPRCSSPILILRNLRFPSSLSEKIIRALFSFLLFPGSLMKAILVPKPGGPEALVWGEAPDPVPGPGEVVVRVRATAVNRADLLQSQGKYPPPPGASEILGLEAAGEVEGTGERVFFLLAGGGYAEKVAVPRSMLMTIPRSLSFAEAAAIPEAWFTAYLNLFQEGGLKAGERVLVHAAASGVGTAAIQLAKRAGASVVATARSAKKCVALVALGADLAVDTSREEFLSRIEQTFGKESVDLVLDPVGGPLFAPNLKALRRGGRVVLIASMAGPSAEIDLPLVLAPPRR